SASGDRLGNGSGLERNGTELGQNGRRLVYRVQTAHIAEDRQLAEDRRFPENWHLAEIGPRSSIEADLEIPQLAKIHAKSLLPAPHDLAEDRRAIGYQQCEEVWDVARARKG